MFRKITVAFDESAEAGKALQTAIELTKLLRASLSAIEPAPIYFSLSASAAPYIRWSDEMRNRYITLQEKTRKFAEDAGISIEAQLSNGTAVESILEATKHNQSDLLVTGMPKQLDRRSYCPGSNRARSLCLLGIR